MTNGEKAWTTLSFPAELYERVKNFIEKHPEEGYTSITEFVKETVRKRLERLQEAK